MMRSAFSLVALACVLALATGLPAHLRLKQRLLDQSDTESHAKSVADVATTTATTTFADADVVAETESGIGMTTDAGLSAETRAQMRAELAALDARRVQRMEAEAARHRFSRVETETEAVVSAYDANHSPWACADIFAWLGTFNGNMAGFMNAAGPAVDEAGLYNNWNGRVPGGAAQAARRAAGQEIIDYVRYAFKQGKNAGNACGVAELTTAADAYALRVAARNNMAAYTMGLEWELHWAASDPENNVHPPVTYTVARSTRTGNPCRQPWVKWATDHKTYQNLVLNTRHTYTVPEMVFGPHLIDVTQNGGGSPTDIALGNACHLIANLRASGHALSSVSVDHAANNYGHVGTAAWAARVHAMNGGAHGGAAVNPRNSYRMNKDLLNPTTVNALNAANPNGRNEMFWRLLNMNPANSNVYGNYQHMFAHEYVQTNYVMSVSALSTTAIMNAQSVYAWRQGAYEAARTAARAYIIAHFGQGGGGRDTLRFLTSAEKADLLGLFTGFNLNMLYELCVDSKTFEGNKEVLITRAQWGNIRAHVKNWWDLMIKTSMHKIVRLASAPVIEALRDWYTSKDFGTDLAWADTIVYLNGFRGAMAASADADVRSWAASMTGMTANQMALKAYALTRLRLLLRMFDFQSNVQLDGVLSTTPTGSDPPAYRVNGVLSFVMESRAGGNNINTASAACNVANLNAALAPYVGQKTWDGQANSWAV